jgi:hypothetical protein
MDAHGKLFGIFAQISKEALFILVFLKDNIILISAADQMINATG